MSCASRHKRNYAHPCNPLHYDTDLQFDLRAWSLALELGASGVHAGTVMNYWILGCGCRAQSANAMPRHIQLFPACPRQSQNANGYHTNEPLCSHIGSSFVSKAAASLATNEAWMILRPRWSCGFRSHRFLSTQPQLIE